MKQSNVKATNQFLKLDYLLYDVLRFDIETLEEKEKTERIIGYNPPNIRRIKETAQQVKYKKTFDEYKILFLSSYRLDLLNFTKAGKIWCHIIGPKKKVGEETKYTRIIYRQGDFIKKAMDEAQFLVHALEHRPSDSKNRPMLLVEDPVNTFNWVSPGNKREKISFFHTIPSDITDNILAAKDQRDYYHTVVRPREGIEVYARDIRILGTQKTGINALPVIQ